MISKIRKALTNDETRCTIVATLIALAMIIVATIIIPILVGFLVYLFINPTANIREIVLTGYILTGGVI